MAYPVTGSPVTAFADGVRTLLQADATLTALVTGVYGHLSEAARTAYPYVVLGRRSRAGDAGAMQTAGSVVTLQLDVWSDAKGPYPVQQILSRIVVLLERRPVTVTGFTVIEGSVTCEFEEIDDEPDEDTPGARLYHGVQRWQAEIHDDQ